MADLQSITLNAEHFEHQEAAKLLLDLVGRVIQSMSKVVDLSSLDGVTISCNYPASLKSLDRGFECSKELQASTGDVVGVAMTAQVLRDGRPKSHIVLNANIIAEIANPESEYFDDAYRVIIHECGHVVHNAAMNRCFPNHFLNYQYKNIHESLRCETWIAVIDEYYATRFSSSDYGEGLIMYEDMLFEKISQFSYKMHQNILLYRFHANIEQLLHETYGEISTIMKFTGYYLGCADALNIDVCKRDKYKDYLNCSFTKYIEKVRNVCQKVYENHGAWSDFSLMEKIADILDSIAIENGVIVKEMDDGSIYVDVP